MESFFQRFTALPSFYDEDQARIAKMLNITIGIILLIALVRTLYAWFVDPALLVPIVTVNSFLFVTFTTAFIVGRLGHLRSASLIVTGTQWTLSALIVLIYGGVAISSYGIFVFVVFVSGLLLGGRWAVGYAVLSILYGTLMLYLENQGVITPPLEDGISAYNTLTPSFITTAVLVYLYDRGITDALFRARTNEQKMAEHAAELQKANQQLADEIAQREALEAQLLQIQKLEAIGRLSGGIAHDLNNLLVPILGYVELSLMRIPDDQKLQRNLERVKDGAERAAALTKQILAFSRKQLLEAAPMNPNQALQSFDTMIRRIIGENIEITTTLNQSDSLILADKAQFEQVLMNLAINARDAMTDGGRLTIRLEDIYADKSYSAVQAGKITAGHYVALTVSDTGHGMDADTQRKIFEPFFTTKAEGKGTGLGLSTVFGIVKQHRGHIWVYSNVGRGTTFKIYWPQADKSAVVAESTDDPQSFTGTETIIVAEDNPMVRSFIFEALSAHNYEVITPDTPHEVVQLVTSAKQNVDLVLTDVIMPLLNGRELHQQIAAFDPTIKILYMSGYTDDIIAHHGLLEQGVNFLSKPFSITELTRKIRQVLDE